MATTLQKRQLGEALADAEAFRAMFPVNTFHRWTISGSVRRGIRHVGDVEHVIIPRVAEVASTGGLFAEMRMANLLLERVDELLRQCMVSRHVYSMSKSGEPVHRWGERYRGMDFRGFNHEIFLADADNWGSALAIRTGPGSFSKMLVNALQRNGHINRDGYVWKKSGMTCAACGWQGGFTELRFRTAQEWVADHGKLMPKWLNGRELAGVCPGCGSQDHLTMQRVSVPEERQYFELCRVDYLDPHKRLEVA